MTSTTDFEKFGQNVVYVKPIQVSELPQELREQAGSADLLYALHRADGERLALVANRRLAFSLARENRMHPVTVH